MKPLQILKQLDYENKAARYPNFPKHAIPVRSYSDRTANGLTKCIIDFIKYSGGQSERINTMGRMIDNTKVVSNVLGQSYRIGSKKWIKGTGTKGSADISSTIPVEIGGKKVGLSVKWEVKMKDRQSDDQKNYEQMIQNASGYYFIVRSFDDFYEKYHKLVNSFK